MTKPATYSYRLFQQLVAAEMDPESLAEETGIALDRIQDYLNDEAIPTREHVEKIAQSIASNRPFTDEEQANIDEYTSKWLQNGGLAWMMGKGPKPP